ncbi:hypothetical protein QYE76_066611 [Lolium multiflorum]|uniref:Uncharacterized protein n=1 Tax=Lolium multiflorum TaxID=4521 RepID=A0AAD8SCE5_LOLMU|nr:hypothetical protein QYE76_066611 [Lolium multiflorum]
MATIAAAPPACNGHRHLSRNCRPSTRPLSPRLAAAVSTRTEVAATAAQPARPQGVRQIAAMESDDEMMVQLFMEEQNPERASTRWLKARQEEEHQADAMLLDADYFADDATHSPKEFRRRFRMNKDLFMKIVFGIREYGDYFMIKKDCTGLWGFTSIQKCTAAMRCLA